jgi:hypothetical protein
MIQEAYQSGTIFHSSFPLVIITEPIAQNKGFSGTHSRKNMLKSPYLDNRFHQVTKILQES